MKVSKKVLKQIVKECLIEILSEGLGSSSEELTVPQQRIPYDRSNNNIPNSLMTSNRAVDESVSRQTTRQPSPNSSVRDAVREMTHQHPGLASIFEDTAQTTLMMQNQAERNGRPQSVVSLQGDRAARIVDAVSPEQLFGEESASKWAELAFMPTVKKL